VRDGKRNAMFVACVAVVVSTFVAVPAAQAVPTRVSDSWAGVKAKDSTPDFNLVEGNWVVPKVKCAPGETSGAFEWLGLGDGIQDTLYQTGTDSDCVNGKPQYAAWWEAFPEKPVPFGDEDLVLAGDHMYASVYMQLSLGQVVMVLIDYGTSGSQTPVWQDVAYHAAASNSTSAECVIERPTMLNPDGTRTYEPPLAHFVRFEFTYCLAYWMVDGNNGGEALMPGRKVGRKAAYSLDMWNIPESRLLVNSSHFQSAGGFTATWKAAA
jgi:hypothetical protein